MRNVIAGAAEAAPLPLYEKIKQHVLDGIHRGRLQPGSKISSETELAGEFGVSRLTVHRALRELSAAGILQRVHGVGTFVSQPRPLSAFIRLHNIADEIRDRGQRLSMNVHELRRVPADAEVAQSLELSRRSPVFHSLIVYRADGVALQIEDRYVSPAFAPDYLGQDFTARSTTDYLQSIAPAGEIEHVMEAVLPRKRQAELLDIGHSEPCLSVTRRTWVSKVATTFTRFIHPGSRHRFISRATIAAPGI